MRCGYTVDILINIKKTSKNIVKTILFDHIGLVQEIRGQLYELAMNSREKTGKTA